MKALRTLLTAIVLLAGALTMNAQRMSIAAMQSNARFLTDRMAYTLGISDPFLIDEIYRINYDYIWGVNDYLDDVALGYYYDDYLAVCAARDAALRNLLGYTVWNRLIGYTYFHRPIVFVNRGWHFSIYDYDRYGMNRYYYHAPRPIARGYAGGHFFRPMAPRGYRRGAPAHVVVPRRDYHAPHVHRGGSHSAPAPRSHQGGGNYNDRGSHFNGNGDVNRGGNNTPAPDMNRGGGNSTPAPRTNSNANSSSRQFIPRTSSTPSLTNASMTTPSRTSSVRTDMGRSSARMSSGNMNGGTRMSSPSRMGGGEGSRGAGNVGGARRGGRR